MTESERGAPLASRSEMSRLQRRLTSQISRVMLSPALRSGIARVREGLRRATRAPHRVHYFHEVGDPYSQLAAQALVPLAERYDIEIVPHLAAPDAGPNVPEPELLATLAQRDCAAVAPHYGLEFPERAAAPAPTSLGEAARLLVPTLGEGSASFAERAVSLGSALWRGDEPALKAFAAERPAVDATRAEQALEAGSARRRKLGHYSGAMFYYAGEWYWGVDRLHHLERRLSALGAARGDGGVRFERPAIAMQAVPRATGLTLEVFPSLRSPYTAVAFDTVVALAERTGVQLVLRPVLPMVMRGVPATFSKIIYIPRDASREGALLGTPLGRVFDPIGEPVRRAYSLWPWAHAAGHGAAFFSAFLRAAFVEGVDTSVDAGLRHVVEGAGLSWSDAVEQLGDPAWEAELETNRLAMVEEMGIWGVPSFRLRGPEGEPELCCWGQDRLWLLAHEIQRRGAAA